MQIIAWWMLITNRSEVMLKYIHMEVGFNSNFGGRWLNSNTSMFFNSYHRGFLIENGNFSGYSRWQLMQFHRSALKR